MDPFFCLVKKGDALKSWERNAGEGGKASLLATSGGDGAGKM